MIPWGAWLALAVAAGHDLNAGKLPVCSNHVINEVVKRAGCTVGDVRCWYRSGGFCNDYVEQRIRSARPAQPLQLSAIRPEDVAPGDVAVFAARAHYALVERVVRDAAGRPAAVDLAEYNFGTCWVDKESMVTEKFKVAGKRAGVALGAVDGGFLRAVPAAP